MTNEEDKELSKDEQEYTSKVHSRSIGLSSRISRFGKLMVSVLDTCGGS